ncbi:hypothetical protein GCM10010495_76350 [Kitasatospora herbaricolor]|nr:hypothetical protein [Kitasatospora herbaricolor]GGV47397.1 hypothetical protein GCM10010495_76350 [Kitasatospora herbaricolor]
MPDGRSVVRDRRRPASGRRLCGQTLEPLPFFVDLYGGPGEKGQPPYDESETHVIGTAPSKRPTGPPGATRTRPCPVRTRAGHGGPGQSAAVTMISTSTSGR